MEADDTDEEAVSEFGGMCFEASIPLAKKER